MALGRVRVGNVVYRHRHAAGAGSVVGLSVQSTAHQLEAIDRLHLPYPLLSDENGGLAEALTLPTFEVEGLQLLKRMSLIINATIIEKRFYPVFPVEDHVDDVRDWLRAHPLPA